MDLAVSVYGIVNSGNLTIYDMANAICGYRENLNTYWDVTAALAKFCTNTIETHNLYFSRIVLTTYTYIKFNGYRLDV